LNFSNFGSLKSTETSYVQVRGNSPKDFSNFGSLKSTETCQAMVKFGACHFKFQQFRLVEEH